MVFSKRKNLSYSNLNIELEGTVLSPSTSVRFLGIVFDPKLSGKNHLEQVICKGKRTISVISALRGTWWGANPNLLLSVYRSMIRASFEYASLIFALNDNRLLVRLQRIQNQAIRIACGYRNSTPINVIHAETREPLLKQKFEYLASKYFLKIISFRDHPVVTKLLEICDLVVNTPRSFYLGTHFPAALVFLHMWSYNKLMLITPGLPAYQNSYYSTCTNVSYLSLPPNILKNFDTIPQQNIQPIFEDTFRRVLARAIVFYTDGSKVNDGTYVGSVVYSPQLDLHFMFKLSSYASVFTSEAWAIYNALLFALHNDLSRIVIVSDSKSVLDSLAGFRNRTNNYIISYIRVLIEEAKFRNTQVSFIWVPSHCGIQDNEIADQLAKKAIGEGAESNFMTPYSDLFSIPRMRLSKAFDSYIERTSRITGEYYFKNCYTHNNKPWFHDLRFSRIMITTLNRLRSNHFNLNYSLFRKNLIDNPSCLCGAPSQDFAHVIFFCPLTEPYVASIRLALNDLDQEDLIPPKIPTLPLLVPCVTLRQRSVDYL
ncbi:hypothetical protein ALC60_01010 [Trachymyrmex zeteki]|uniref:RNase H type-1 domain-containing protein n=2 Tax=Mycetomoellerius zeteki TaxID=64791 RepID=A0A151XHX2_9HYME|nr:hypothetical protein ALC60_01010 [Trachymyrmex zeteki]